MVAIEFWDGELRVVRLASLASRHSQKGERPEFNTPHLDEQAGSPDFIPAESQPAQVEFNGVLRFAFPTPRPCEFAENNTAYGRLYRCAGRWQKRPVIIQKLKRFFQPGV